jgi:hypothetical protein
MYWFCSVCTREVEEYSDRLLGCAENVDWLFEHHGDAGVSKAALEDAVDLAVSKGHMQVARTLQVHCQRLG